MRILYHADHYWPHLGGVETVLRHLAEGVAARGHEVMVVANQLNGVPDQETRAGVKVHRLLMNPPLLQKNLPQVVACLKQYERLRAEFQPDVVHHHFCGPSAYYAYYRPHPITVTSIHDPLGMTKNTFSARAVKASRAVVAVSRFVSERCRLRFPDLKTRLIYNALLPKDRPRVAHQSASARFLCLGRVVRDKGFDLAIEAFARLGGGASLDIVGQGPERTALIEQAAQLGLQVSFPGALSDEEVLTRIDSCAALLMPSRWEECFGLAAFEAMSRGRPVIAARWGALPEVVLDGETGLLFEHENVLDLADKIRLLRDDTDLCARLGQQAAEAPLRFPYARMLDEHLELYHSFLEAS
jgi:glycosyltransferase involved in cell wall biosynthesis